MLISMLEAEAQPPVTQKVWSEQAKVIEGKETGSVVTACVCIRQTSSLYRTCL